MGKKKIVIPREHNQVVIVVTNHALRRLAKRSGLSKTAAMRMAEKAYVDGVTHKETKGNLNRWVTSQYFVNRKANNIRLYGDKAFIFCSNILITVLQIPHDLVKDVKRIRNKRT